MKNLMKQIGKEKLLNMLKKSAEMFVEIDKDADINYNGCDINKCGYVEIISYL
jgi:hypothetical protein